MTEPFKPDWNTEAVLVEEMQRMGKRIEDLEMLLKIRGEQIVERFVEIVQADESDRAMRENAYVQAEREALIRYFDGHWREEWSDGQIIEALEARGNT